ncbi:ATP-binding protein [Allomesorhizobium camelthorni]|uniref:Transcriptional regulator n=1 Tax=Allomesorhizobium camelthorni TaxID=475069 RepID=A0A6G4WP77_9HYPH|nr:winged helix-turn-helix domain-containing protein [Mesorhizobium camelthorni]NGO56006.1 transcriptional regulator [Mesorhizobium camelthorni]
MDDCGNPHAKGVFSFGPFCLITTERLLQKGDERVQIGGRALDILIMLVERAGEVISHTDLISRVWPDITVEEANLRVNIAGLRKALGDGRDGARYIANVPGRGYCFVAPVQSWAQGGVSSAAMVGPVRIQTLPVRLERMIGRDETVKTVVAEVASRRFVSIVGPGGVGKTTVALAVAHAMASDFGDAVCFADLSALHDGALVVPAIASSVGCISQTQDSLPRLSAFLADKRILLVLDSCEHVMESVALMTERLFRDGAFVHIVTTTREALRVEGENIHMLQSLDSPRSEVGLTVVEALASSAVQLFMDRAAAGGYRHELSDEEAPIIAGICRQLDGIPLAIEVVASRAGAYGLTGLARLINDRLILHWRGRRSHLRHQTLQVALDWSYNLLSEPEQAIFSTLSVFVGAFTLEMAQAVIDEPDVLEVANVIARLVEKSLVSVSQTGDARSYRLLDTTRAYAAFKLVRRGEENVIARRHALYYAERLAPIRSNILRDRNLSSYSRHVGDIKAALEWSFSTSGDASVGVALGAGAVPLFLGLSMLSECRFWCEQTIRALGEEDRGTKLELALQLSLAISSIYVLGNSDEVGTALERGITLADSLGDSEYQLHLLAGLNLFRTRLADFGGALAAAERYVAVAKEVGRPREIVAAEWMLGASYHLIGNQAAARHSYKIGFERAVAAGISQMHSYGYDHQVRALIGDARALWLCGFPDQAARRAHQGIEVAERQNHPVSLCICLLYVIPVFLWRGDQLIAEDLIERLIACAGKHSLAPYHAGGLGLRGELMLARGRTMLGVEALRTALSTLQEERQYILSFAFSRALAEGLARSGHPAEATTIIDALVADATRGSGTFELPNLLRVQAEVQLAAAPANWPAAEASLIGSLDCAREQSALGWELRSAIALCRLWVDHGRVDEGHHGLAQVYERFSEGFDTADLTEARRWLRAPGVRSSHD